MFTQSQKKGKSKVTTDTKIKHLFKFTAKAHSK